MRIALFYHCLFFKDGKFLPNALEIAQEQMAQVEESGLLGAASEFWVGINGGQESLKPAGLVFPPEATMILHGLQCRNENRTVLALEKWLPGHEDWYVLYFHCKGATNTRQDPIYRLKIQWRNCMMRHCVTNWRQCVADLDAGYESVGAHWMTGEKTPPGQSIWAGTFFWAKASLLATLPSVAQTARVKESGLDAVESRYEAEVWIGNGPRLPKVKDYHPDWDPSKMHTCV